MTRKKILWLCSWYPNKIEPFNGDFIKRHAEAVSLYEDIQVIYVVRDLKGVITKDVLIAESIKGKLKEKIIYYYIHSSGLSIIDRFLSESKYRKLYKQAILKYIDKSGMPDLAHVHVGMKAGVIAKWLRKKKAVQYVISEHWSGILQEANERIGNQSFFIRYVWRKVIKGASGFSAVSEYLAKAVQKQFALTCQISIIPNVIDKTIFYPVVNTQNVPRFIHISGLNALKNPKSIIKAFAIVKNLYPLAMLDIFGPFNKDLAEFARILHAEKSICFHGEVPQQQLSKYLQQSMALILYSTYETFGCVIIEANACGIPVIVSDIPVFHETVEEGVNGTFAKKDDPKALAERMIAVLINQLKFNNAAIAEKTVSKYSYEVVGKKFNLWYSEILLKA